MRFVLNSTEYDAQLSKIKCAELNVNMAFYDRYGMKRAVKSAVSFPRLC